MTKKIHQLKIIFICIPFLGLVSCAGMNSNFGCDARAGDSCTPVSKVNQNAQAGDYDNADSGDLSQSSESNTQTFGYANKTENSNAGYNVPTPIPGQPIRFGDTVQRIWIAPYEDASQNYHEPSYVYTVLDKSHWIGLPAQEVNETSDGD